MATRVDRSIALHSSAELDDSSKEIATFLNDRVGFWTVSVDATAVFALGRIIPSLLR